MKKLVILGLDIGTIKIAWYVKDIVEEKFQYLESNAVAHLGNPRQIICNLWNRLLEQNYEIARVIATGELSNLLASPISVAPEQAAQEEALKIFCKKSFMSQAPFNLVRIGGGGYSILTYRQGEFKHKKNDKCSAGTGWAIKKMCNRFGVNIPDACDMVCVAKNSYKIAARCSVFAKSEMTHLTNDGYPKGEVLASYFDSIAKNIWSFAQKWKVEGHIFLVGGVVKNKRVAQKFTEYADETISIIEQNDIFEAAGACRIAQMVLEKKGLNFFPQDTEKIFAAKDLKIKTFSPLHLYSKKVIKIEKKFFKKEPIEETFLGLDLGSTGSKLAIIDKETKELIYDDYCRTNADPVGAAQKLISKIPKKYLEKIELVGITGSGRNTVATMLKTSIPVLANKIIVETEIVAHANGAVYYDSDNGKSLSVIEIGGQDAKYTLVEDGGVVESDMNKACSAGTGSFLEEQGIEYGVPNIVKFDALAYKAENPPDLGQQCTVFVADLANKALQQGFTQKDIFAGFYYAVVHNYINRVMGNRMFGEKIFLQGKPASDDSLACVMAAVTGKDIIVPPNPGVMGAFGITLVAAEKLAEENLAKVKVDAEKAQYFDFTDFLNAKLISRKNFRCDDKKCGNYCRIGQMEIEVNGKISKVVTGGQCPKYESVGSKKRQLDLPNAFKRRKILLKEIIERNCFEIVGKETIAIPNSLALVRFLPFFVAFFSRLDMNVKVLNSSEDALSIGDELCGAADACSPIKMFHGVAAQGDQEGIDYLFLPKITSLPAVKEEKISCTCPLVQGVSNSFEYVLKERGIKILKPILQLGKGLDGAQIVKSFFQIGKDFKAAEKKIAQAFYFAVDVQRVFEYKCQKIGVEVLEYAKMHNLPVVVICGRLYTLYDNVLNSSIPQIIQENGVLALPVDCFPVGKNIPVLDLMYWGEGQRNLRALLEAIKKNNVFPLWLTNYGCGPDSFLEHFFKQICHGYPHTIIETDGHTGTGGFKTRVQAFLASCDNYWKKQKKISQKPKLSYYQKSDKQIKLQDRQAKLCFPPMGRGNELMVAVYRSCGINAEALPPIEKDSFLSGGKDCSGKECIPFRCVWGSIKSKLLSLNEQKNVSEKLIFFVPTTEGPCRFCMYHVRIKQLLDEFVRANSLRKDAQIELFSSTTKDNYNPGLNKKEKLKLWAAVVVADLLQDMLLEIRPAEKNKGETSEIYKTYFREFVQTFEKPSSSIILDSWGVFALMKKAAAAFRKISIDKEKEERLFTVALVGEIYVRQEEFANNFLIKKLEKYGARVKLAGVTEWIEYISFLNWKEKKQKNRKEIVIQNFIKRQLHNICADVFGWGHPHKISDILEEGYPYLGKAPTGEAVITIGAPILMHQRGEIDGVVVVGPDGCMPTKLAEMQLSRIPELPSLFVYSNGDLIDEQKIAGFAWQLGGINSLKD